MFSALKDKVLKPLAKSYEKNLHETETYNKQQIHRLHPIPSIDEPLNHYILDLTVNARTAMKVIDVNGKRTNVQLTLASMVVGVRTDSLSTRAAARPGLRVRIPM